MSTPVKILGVFLLVGSALMGISFLHQPDSSHSKSILSDQNIVYQPRQPLDDSGPTASAIVAPKDSARGPGKDGPGRRRIDGQRANGGARQARQRPVAAAVATLKDTRCRPGIERRRIGWIENDAQHGRV